ncbi:LysM peptidoglycan-binding domain-containing protein [Vibrio hepatarius]|uniref:LysM peptidoglycan-binding domain-containing protein n=1 Tax=Vibrio hepatarius TaxID=171383 RepID=UPI003736B86A
MFKKNIITIASVFTITCTATEYDELFYISSRFDFIDQLDLEDESNFVIAHTIDFGIPIYKTMSVENTIRYIGWNSEEFESNTLQYGMSLRVGYSFSEKISLGFSGGILTDLDVGSASRSKETNAYTKFDVYYSINNNWALVLGFNQSFSSNYSDQYAYSLGVKYRFYENKHVVGDESVCDCIFTGRNVVQPISLKIPDPVIDEVMKRTLDYVVKEGDHIYQICRRFNMSFDEFANMNQTFFLDRDVDYIYPGEIVKVKYPQ